MKNFFKKLGTELRRIRWSSTTKTSKSFLYTIIFVSLATGIIVLFSWLITSLIRVLK